MNLPRPRLLSLWFPGLVACLAFPPWSNSQTEITSASETIVPLTDRASGNALTHHQQWGNFGWNTAAARPGTTGSPLRIGSKTYDKGLGHHANGEIIIELNGLYDSFSAILGVQWQGGGKGSVVFRISADGKTVFESEPMSDSDPAKEIQVPLENAQELRLIASDNGDGIACDMANWVEARLHFNPNHPFFETPFARFNNQPAPAPSADVGGFFLMADSSGPQLAVMNPTRRVTTGVRPGEEVRLTVPVQNAGLLSGIMAEASLIHGSEAEVELSLGGQSVRRRLAAWQADGGQTLELAIPETTGKDPGSESQPTTAATKSTLLHLTVRGLGGEAGVRWHRLRYESEGRWLPVPWRFPKGAKQIPPTLMPALRPPMEQELIEWDWRLQDGIGTSREPRTWAEATEKVLRQGNRLLEYLVGEEVDLQALLPLWRQLEQEWNELASDTKAGALAWENLWRKIHQRRRQIVLENPLAEFGPVLFAKRVPSNFSHQLTQYYGMCARPGGGIFLLEHPGSSMKARALTNLPQGSVQHPEVSWDGHRVLFAFCAVDSLPLDRDEKPNRHYHLYEMNADGSDLRQLTRGPYDDFSPRYLPDGRILFLSTRRGGYHRCGRGPCPTYTLALAEADGSDPRVISYHETHEWDPVVLNDGRVLYTRWDYVDRHAVHYQQLWTVNPDGSNVRIFYGNNTLNPVGVWEARPVPGSRLVMATAGAHHAMTAGSIILIDVQQGTDGLEPITRLTPDALFPESEFAVGSWHAPAGVASPPPVPEEERRWPGHCYRTPHPLSEDFFLAAYSFDPLIGEPHANPPNMFGLYLVDRFGNKELLYRDLNISSLWPTPLRPRPRPLILTSGHPAFPQEEETAEGTFFVQNVQESWPPLPAGEENRIMRLRIVQVLPKTTPHANSPRVGLANASPGKQVLGTVPVEPDGSAYFRAPAGIPLSFQALDRNGMAVQTMRSLTYLQPGEQSSCIGCHERPERVPDATGLPLARQRSPSVITPGPDGSRPFSYPRLVQPVLDRHCVDCHGEEKPAGGIALTGTAKGDFTVSYHALAPMVPYSEWRSTPQGNAEPLTLPDHFGARASPLMAMMLQGHEDVQLSRDHLERLATWMDANALFYGTFDQEDQRRQQRGERIAGPALE